MESKQDNSRSDAANRANAQKSTGPKTPEGKAKSSRNSLRHGLCSTTFVVRNEDLAEYTALRDAYVDRFGPRDQVELDPVERMVHATWNQHRCWTLENEIYDLQMLRMEAQLAKEYVDLPERTRLAAAAEELAKQPGLPLFHRYDARASIEMQRALKTFTDLRKNVPLAPPGAPIFRGRTPLQPPLPDEPIPISEHRRPHPILKETPSTSPRLDGL